MLPFMKHLQSTDGWEDVSGCARRDGFRGVEHELQRDLSVEPSEKREGDSAGAGAARKNDL